MEVFGFVNSLQQSLDYHVARHNLLTANLAHVDTPGYRPLELDRSSGFRGEMNAAMVKTNANHFGTEPGKVNWRVMPDPVAQPTEDGNAVSIDRESVKIAANHVRYQAIAQLTSGALDTMVWAARDGRNG